jgi:arylsulfatase A-like enzyme
MNRLMISMMAWVSMVGCDQHSAPQEAATLASKPDVLIVILDTVRADMVSTYGYRHPTTPQLDAVGEAGVVFEDVTAPASWTWPSHASLFTGVGPWEHGAHASVAAKGVGLAGGHWGLLGLRPELPTLADRFEAAGYRTVSLASNRFLDKKLGLTRGFEITETMQDLKLSERAIEIIDETDDRPLFMFVNILLAHAPWEVYPVPWSIRHTERLKAAETVPDWTTPFLMKDTPGLDLGVFPPGASQGGYRQLMSGELLVPDQDMEMVEDLYTGGITAADFLLNKILERWTATRPAGIVAVTSDHGEYLGEHGLWDHGKTIFDQVTQVPLVIAAPGRLPKGKRVSTPVQLHDLHDTVLDLAGIDGPKKLSLLPVIEGKPRSGPILAKSWASRAWLETLGGRFVYDWTLYREGDFALISSSGGHRQLFDLGKDRAMAKDLSAEMPLKTAELAEKADSAFPQASSSTEGVEMSKEIEEELQALGYLE